MRNLGLITIILFLLISCKENEEPKAIENIKAEIYQVEKNFTEMAQNEGIALAFVSFAADDAVLNRNDSIISGKEDIRKYFSQHSSGDAQLVWAPDFVDVSRSGDMAYTFGKYTYTSLDSAGNSNSSSGVFHTVWKRQKDGSWKFVWD